MHVRTRDAISFQVGIAIFLIIVFLVILIPLWRVIMTAVVPLDVYTQEGIPFFLAPWNWTAEAFKQLIGHSLFPRALLNSVIITVLGTLISLLLTVPLAYGLSVRNLPGRKLIMIMVLFTYLFSPGLIPVYLLITGMGLTDNFLSIILPPAVSVYNTLVMMRFFEGLPDELREAAALDGANEFQILTSVVLPLSKPIILTIGLFYGGLLLE